jgi:hypothetical protein
MDTGLLAEGLLQEQSKIMPNPVQSSGSNCDEDEIHGLLRVALSKSRSPLKYATEYSHASVAKWLGSLLPDNWTVSVPAAVFPHKYNEYTRVLSDEYPKPGSQQRCVEKWLADAGCPDPPDAILGACESFGILLSHHAVKLLGEGVSAPHVCDLAHSRALDELKLLGGRTAAARLFKDLLTCVKLNGFDTGPWMWREAFGDVPDKTSVADLLYGTATAREAFTNAVAEAITSDKMKVLPLYVLVYVFAEKELLANELCTDGNTACYDSHVLGVLLDPTTRSAVIVDSNGGLLANGNIEFVSMPLRALLSPPTTSISQYERCDKPYKAHGLC